jgi:hypothetical protein
VCWSEAFLRRSCFFEYFRDSTEPDEWLTKMLLMHFHHRCERVRLFTELKKPEDVAGFSGEAEVLRGQLCENAFFGRLEVSRQKELLPDTDEERQG